MSIKLRTNDFQAFFDAPFNAYGPESRYVSPLKSDLKRFLSRKNPLFKGKSAFQLFTAHRDGRPVGRISAHFHAESNAKHQVNDGYFGYFDCEDNTETAAALLGAAEGWCADRGFNRIAGNFNLTAMQQIGVQTDGFEHDPCLDQIYSPPHIALLLEANGYQRLFPMTTFRLPLQDVPLPAFGAKQEAIAKDKAFSFAPINRDTIEARLEDARTILNASFADNPMFVPLTKAEFEFQAKDLKWVMDPRISAVLHHKGEPAACIICMPDVNPFLKAIRSRFGLTAPFRFIHHRIRNTRAVLIFIGVMPHLHSKGVNPYVMHHVLSAMDKAGYTEMANTWIADENGASLAQARKVGALPMHRLHLFSKAL